MTYLILLLHIPALFLTSLVQTTGYKMAIFTILVVLFCFVSFCFFVAVVCVLLVFNNL